MRCHIHEGERFKLRRWSGQLSRSPPRQMPSEDIRNQGMSHHISSSLSDPYRLRHNGVVIEPTEQYKKEGGDDEGTGSQSGSRSATPSSKGKERALTLPHTVQTHPTGSGSSSGPSSYYRPHTTTTTRRRSTDIYFSKRLINIFSIYSSTTNNGSPLSDRPSHLRYSVKCSYELGISTSMA